MSREINQQVVHELLLCDPHTGQLTWRRRERKWFKSDHDCRRWNTRYAGKHAFTYINADGYATGAIFHQAYRRSHIVWLYMTGKLPRFQIDHENRKRADDRFGNLREATDLLQQRNKFLPINNTSGRVGVYRDRGRYCAQIGIRGRIRHLGYFRSFDQACAVREAAEMQYGFSLGHGRRRLIRSAEQTMH